MEVKYYRKIHKNINSLLPTRNAKNTDIQSFETNFRILEETNDIKIFNILLSGLLFMLNNDSFEELKNKQFYPLFNRITANYSRISRIENLRLGESFFEISDDISAIHAIFIIKHYKHPLFPKYYHQMFGIRHPYVYNRSFLTSKDYDTVFSYINYNKNNYSTRSLIHYFKTAVILNAINAAKNMYSVLTIRKHFLNNDDKKEICAIVFTLLEIKNDEANSVDNTRIKLFLGKILLDFKCDTDNDPKLIRLKNYYLKTLFTKNMPYAKAMNLFDKLYEEVTYRPGNTGYLISLAEFSNLLKINTELPNKDINNIILRINDKYTQKN